MVRPTINSVKHIVQRSLFTIDAQTIANVAIVSAVESPATSNQVRIGAEVKAVWVELWYIGSSSQPVIQNSSFEKLESGKTSMLFTESQTLHDYPNKKNLFKTTQGIVGDANTNPTPVFREWIAIPKGKQRMGLGDTINLNISALGEASNDLEVCGEFVYKEYF